MGCWASLSETQQGRAAGPAPQVLWAAAASVSLSAPAAVVVWEGPGHGNSRNPVGLVGMCSSSRFSAHASSRSPVCRVGGRREGVEGAHVKTLPTPRSHTRQGQGLELTALTATPHLAHSREHG